MFNAFFKILFNGLEYQIQFYFECFVIFETSFV